MKRWTPFLLTLLLAGGGAAFLYLNRAQLGRDLQEKLTPGSLRAQSGPAGGKSGSNGKAGAGPNKDGAPDKNQPRVTRNGIRSIIENAIMVQNMTEEEVLALIDKEGFNGSFRSPIMAMTLFTAFTRLAELNPTAALAKASSLKGEASRMATFAAMHEWLLRDRKSAVSWFTAQPDGDSLKKREFIQMATFSMGPGDPTIISELSGALEPGDLREAQKNLVLAKLMTDPDAALKEINKIEDQDERARVSKEALQMLQWTAPDKAVALSLKAGADDPLRAQMAQSVGSWGSRDPKAALDWLAKQPKNIQGEVFSGNKLIGTSFAGATDEDLKTTSLRLNDQKQRDQLYAGAAAGQAGSNPSGAFERLAVVQDKEMQQQAATQIGQTIGRSGKAQDLDTWLDTSPAPALRDTVIQNYATSVAGRDAASAETYVNRITNPTLRAETLKTIQNIQQTPKP